MQEEACGNDGHTGPCCAVSPIPSSLFLIAAWENDLQEYSRTHPEVRVIDSIESIRTLRNRGTMLTVLRGEDIVLQASGAGTETQSCKFK